MGDGAQPEEVLPGRKDQMSVELTKSSRPEGERRVRGGARPEASHPGRRDQRENRTKVKIPRGILTCAAATCPIYQNSHPLKDGIRRDRKVPRWKEVSQMFREAVCGLVVLLPAARFGRGGNRMKDRVLVVTLVVEGRD